MSLEGLDRSVLTQLTHMDAHVCAAGGKRVVALPVYVQSRCCWEAENKLRAAAAVGYVENMTYDGLNIDFLFPHA